jgi:hypothetical protein
MYLRTFGSPQKTLSPLIANQQIMYYPKITKRNRSANRKSAKCHISEWSANLTNYLSLQICGFAICEMYLRSAHHCTYTYIQYSPTYQLP